MGRQLFPPVAAFIGVLVLSLVTGSESQGSFPGQNGRIVFASDRDGDFEIYTINPDGKGLRKLTRNRVDDTCPSWSASGRKIAFTRSWKPAPRSISYVGIWTMKADGSGKRRLTRGEFHDSCPAWSPNGKTIAFGRYQSLHPGRISDLFTMNANGGAVRRLTYDDGAMPAWSPRGDTIAFGSFINTDPEIHTMNPDGSNRRWLTNNYSWDVLADWSPDGRRILFVSNRDEHEPGSPGTYELYTMAPDGTDVRRITYDHEIDHSAVWSPDGRKIVFPSEPRFGPQIDLYVMNADGTGRRRLTRSRAQERDPDWAPR
jgi:TolB protein